MKSENVYIILLVYALLAWSCREPYDPENLDTQEKVLIVDGCILAGSSPEVKLYWAIPYENDKNNLNYITDAQVSITDNLGDKVNLNHAGGGYYFPSDGTFTGVIGRTYILTVTLSDGNSYVSGEETIPDRPVVDSIFAIPGSRKIYFYNSLGEVKEDNQIGLGIYTNQTEQSAQTLYFRYNTRIIEERSYVEDVNLLTAHPVYVWETFYLDDKYTVEKSVLSANLQLIRMHEMGFLRYYYDPSLEIKDPNTGIVRCTAPRITGWLVAFSVYSISPAAYKYYNSVAEQLDDDTQLFAPIPAQTKSNMRCISNSDLKVTGLFEATSVTSVYAAFGWNGLFNHYFKPLDTLPEVGNGSVRLTAPDFWVIFP